ncbi:Na+/H+ antiporter NhaA [Phreatobacter stygius]|uniref:Na(+)/H(+) antiporter NhaA n=1 Tax=Phreatobacter stygius TaxID=1940610 RepID=A0A4D7B904_9HYPH|nr:Na+/H+ antiporter NhaA [Phreatobacter stygius]QCI66718.1 Na+/H+ antiporter NhaA [Phreatobacter stygius]
MTRPSSASPHRPISALRAFIASEASGGIVLMVAAAVAMVMANSAAAPIYFAVLKTYIGPLSVLHWINDGLMALFFLLVGLEIKREFVDGQLSTWPRRVLPGIAAAGGMVAPAVIYLALNVGTPPTLRGWAIPTATDIAFALGVLALIGSRVPVSLKIFLTALAIIDDLGAIAIIAAFYTADLSLAWFAAALAVLVVLAGLNRMGVERLPVYLVLGAALWFFLLKSGIHATLAGVALALTIPLRTSPGRPDDPHSPLHILEHALHPWVAYLIVPVFGFANAGVSLSGINVAALVAPVPLGIAAGLFLGKQIGVFLTTWIAVKLDWADCPENASWPQVYGVSLLCGIGFTMSLFIGLLAFPTSELLQNEVKIGVLMGSLLSALVGTLVLLVAKPAPPPAKAA